MNRLSRLRQLAALSTASAKEFGILTKNEPSYDKDGHFTGIENHYNGPGIAEAAGGAALVGAGLGAGHVGIMKKYGTDKVNREKGRFITPKQVKVPVAQAYKKAGSDVLAKIRSLAGKRFSAQDRLKELAEKSGALKSFDQKVDKDGHPILDTAVGAGLGAGAVLGHQAIRRNYGQGGAGIGAAYGAAAKDAKAGFQNAFNPPSTSEGSGMVATAATNSPLSHDGAKFSGTAPSVDAAPGVGGTAKVVEDSEEALKAMKPGVAYRAGAAAGGIGSKIRGLLSGLRKVV